MLEQLWSELSLEHTLERTVSYVRIPVHPRTVMQWNQMTQMPSLPLRFDPPPPPTPTPLVATGPMSKSTGPATLITPRQGTHMLHRSGSGASRRALPVQPPEPSARSHFPLLGSRQDKHCNAGRRTQPLHNHVLKPQPTIRRVRHTLGQARRGGSPVPH